MRTVRTGDLMRNRNQGRFSPPPRREIEERRGQYSPPPCRDFEDHQGQYPPPACRVTEDRRQQYSPSPRGRMQYHGQQCSPLHQRVNEDRHGECLLPARRENEPHRPLYPPPPRREIDDNRRRYSPSPCREDENRKRRYSPPPGYENDAQRPFYSPSTRMTNEDHRRHYSPSFHCEKGDNRLRLPYEVLPPQTGYHHNHGERPRTLVGGDVGGYNGAVGVDRDLNPQFRRQLSGIDEGLGCTDSLSKKLRRKSSYDGELNPGANAANSHYNGRNGGNDSTRSTEREYLASRYTDLGALENVATNPMSMEIKRSGPHVSPYHPDASIGQGPPAHLNRNLQSPMPNSNLGVEFYSNELSARNILCKNDPTRRDLVYKNYENPIPMNVNNHHFATPSHLQNREHVSMSSGITNNKFPGNYSDDLHASPDEISMARRSALYDVPTFNSSVNHDLQVKNETNHTRQGHFMNDPNFRDCANPEAHTTDIRDCAYPEKRDFGALSDEICRKSVKRGYEYQDRLRASNYDPLINRANDTQDFNNDQLRQSRVLEHHQSLREQSVTFKDFHSLQQRPVAFEDPHSTQERLGVYEDNPSLPEYPSALEEQFSLQKGHVPVDYHDMREEHASFDYPSINQGCDLLNSNIPARDFKIEPYRTHERLDETIQVQDHASLGKPEIHLDHPDMHQTQVYGYRQSSQMFKDYAVGGPGVPVSYDDNHNQRIILDCVAGHYGMSDRVHQRYAEEELDLPGRSEMIFKRKHGIKNEVNRHNMPRTEQTIDQGYDPSAASEQTIDHGIDNLHCFRNKKALRSSMEMASNKICNSGDWLVSHSLPKALRMRLSRPEACDPDIKMRLSRPELSGDRDIKMRLSRPELSGDRDFKKRLKSGPQNNLKTSFMKTPSIKYETRREDYVLQSIDTQMTNHSEVRMVPAKTEPPENSEKFKQLVNTAFFKIAKQIYESPGQKRRYMEQGNAGKLKCIVCDSKSEFVDMKSLAMHAVNSPKVGFRSQHLGFHKALCVLLGWNSTVYPNSSSASLILTKPEAWALKEDLLIWPPVFIIHNSSIGNNDSDHNIPVTVKELETILKDMGFGGNKVKVSLGEPVNQSIMIVKFNGTLTGLQDAHNLQNLFSDKKHGRSDFEQISSQNLNTKPLNKLEENAQSVLYGFVGIAEDLDKLDNQTKKRCLLRSMKEIQARADASLNICG